MKKVKLKWKKEPSAIDKEIENLAEVLQKIDDVTCEKYAETMKRLNDLVDIKGKLNPVKEAKSIDPNTLITAAATIITTFGGVILLTNYETLNIVSKNAFAFIPKPKL